MDDPKLIPPILIVVAVVIIAMGMGWTIDCSMGSFIQIEGQL